jgi:hypothetical protein
MVSRDPIPDDDWKDWYYKEHVVELDGIEPSTSTLPELSSVIYCRGYRAFGSNQWFHFHYFFGLAQNLPLGPRAGGAGARQ